MLIYKKLERERENRLSKQPYKEGHYNLDGRIVRIRASLYPKIKWWIEETDLGDPIESSKRELTNEEGERLKPFI